MGDKLLPLAEQPFPAAESGPRIADKNFTDTRIFLTPGQYREGPNMENVWPLSGKSVGSSTCRGKHAMDRWGSAAREHRCQVQVFMVLLAGSARRQQAVYGSLKAHVLVASSIKPHPKPRNFGHKRKKEVCKENEVAGEEFAQIPLRGQNFGQIPFRFCFLVGFPPKISFSRI